MFDTTLHCLRGEAAQLFYCVLWNMRFAHVPQNTIKQASAAGANPFMALFMTLS